MKEPKQLVIVVHGGEGGLRDDDGVKTRTIKKNTYGIDQDNPLFGEVLDSHLDPMSYEAIAPLFPNALDANKDEWVRFLLQILEVNNAQERSIQLVGHSLGTTCIQNALVEMKNNNIQFDIRAIHLVGCCLGEGNFVVSPEWEIVNSYSTSIYLYHSEDDPICPIADAQEYNNQLPKSQLIIYQDQGHFEVPYIRELIENISKTV
jgi:predicted alpha/beta hydrolase family esterase